MLDTPKIWAKWLWAHRTKSLGLAAVGVAYVQNNLAQLGKVLSPALQGTILGGFGILAFVIGLYNTFAKSDDPK